MIVFDMCYRTVVSESLLGFGVSSGEFSDLDNVTDTARPTSNRQNLAFERRRAFGVQADLSPTIFRNEGTKRRSRARANAPGRAE